MTSLNTYLNALKPFTNSIQKTATKLTDVLDDKLNKTQESLEKLRIRVAEASDQDTTPRLWRSSSDNPLGEVVVIPPPPPPPPNSPPPATPAPIIQERPKTLPVKDETRTVHRKKPKRQRKIDDFEDDNEQQLQQQIAQCLNDIIDQIPEQEIKTETKLINIPIITNDYIENNSISQQDILLTQSESLQTNTTIEESLDLPENDFLDSLRPLDNSLERSNSYVNNFSIKSPSIEQFDIEINQSPIKETTIIPPPFNIPTIIIQEDSSIDIIISPPTIEPNPVDSLPSITDSPPTIESDLSDSSQTIEPNVLIDSPPTEESKIIDVPPIVELPVPVIKKEKCFPLVHCYALPPNIVVSHMSASSTHIYLCTDEYAIFYATAPETHLTYPLQWYQYSLPAEKIIVSDSNQTIWRVFDKTIYSSSDTIKLSPLGIYWTELSFSKGQTLLSISITDQYGWYIKDDGSLWSIKISDDNQEPINIDCPFELNHVVCCTDKVGVTTNFGQIIIRIGCTNECPEGDGWIFIEHNFGGFNDFSLINNNNMICIMDKKHRLWIHDWSKSNDKFYEIIRNDEIILTPNDYKYKLDINNKYLCYTDCHEQLYIFSNCLIGIHWLLIEKETRLQRLIAAFPNENHVWALTTDGMICSSNGQKLDKPRQAQSLTDASFVSNQNSQNAILWSLDESCQIYIRENIKETSQWEQLDQTQFDWSRRLVDLVCNTVGVWAVDDRGHIHFRYGHTTNSKEFSVLNPAWIPIPGEAIKRRSFAHIFCGPEKWMVYATDIKQNVYARVGIADDNHMGTAWNIIEDCSALQIAISEHTLWLLTSHGQVQCRENISLTNPIGTRTITLPGRFNSMTVSRDDEQMWTLFPPHHLFKLDRLTVPFEK